MEAMAFNSLFFNHEISFCKVYGMEGKEKLEKLFLKNGISFYIKDQADKPWERLRRGNPSEKSVFTVHINEADESRARDLIVGLEFAQAIGS